MKITLSLSKDHNPNYLCTIVRIEKLRKHPNVDKLQLAEVFGTDVIIDSSTRVGDEMHFPIECCTNAAFLTMAAFNPQMVNICRN